MRPTDHAARDLATLHRDVAFGRAGGQIIWQPRIQCWMTDKLFANEPFPAPYTGMTQPQIYRSLGCSARLYDYNACFQRTEHASVRFVNRKINETDTERLTITPVGTLQGITRSSRNSPRESHVKWPVVTAQDVRVATWLEENAAWRFDGAKYAQLKGDLGDLGAPTMFMPRINIQHMYINVTGVIDTVYALSDFPDDVRAYFRALDDCHDRMIDVINQSPIDIINFGDNLHCGTLSPPLFEEFVLPAYQRRCSRLHSAGKFVCSHWDGDVASLLPYARQTGLDGIEAITPRPQGDVDLQTVKEALGDMYLIDGVSAILFDPLFPEEELLAQARQVIDLFAPNLILGISDEISSTGDIERIRSVGRLVDDYNAAVARRA